MIGRLKVFAAWAGFVPAAIVGSWLAHFLSALFNRMSLYFAGIDPDGFIGKFYIEAFDGAIIGTAFVYIGAYVAPRYKREISLILSAVALVIGGVLIAFSLIEHRYWATWSAGWMIAAVCVTAYAAIIGEIFASPPMSAAPHRPRPAAGAG